jgi:hypothetical protein
VQRAAGACRSTPTLALMANTTPTSVSFWAAVKLVALLLFKPDRFLEIQAENTAALNAIASSGKKEGALVVRRAFFYAFLLVLVSASLGYGLGLVLNKASGCFTTNTVAWFQVIGTCLLLWGTLFIRGWEIQTYGGTTLTERVNQWIYRTLYCAGTGVLVASLALTTCK